MRFRWDEIQHRPDGKVLLSWRHERIFAEGLVKAGDRVLDVGGWGVLAQRMAQEGADALILDLFTADQAYPERVRALPHKVGDVRDAGNFAPGAFDLVTAFEMLEHCGGIEDAIDSMHLWLRDGGVIAGTVPIPGVVHAADEPGVEFVSQSKLARMLRGAGFERVLVEPTRSMDRDDPAEPECSLYFRGWKKTVAAPAATPTRSRR